MINVGVDGELVIVTTLQCGEDWLNRFRAILNLVANSDPSLVGREDIYYSLSVAADMLPDEETANALWKAYKEKV